MAAIIPAPTWLDAMGVHNVIITDHPEMDHHDVWMAVNFVMSDRAMQSYTVVSP